MLEEKVEELKISSPPTPLLQERGEVLSEWQNFYKGKKIETSLELNIEAYLSNELFESDLDKLNFYKEIESINSLEELEELRQDFEKWQNTLSKSERLLFKILEVRIKASDYKIKSIKKLWVSYEINFVENITIEELKKFLSLDEKVYFIVNSLNKLKCSCQKFRDDEDFLNYLYEMFFGENKKKVKLKLKSNLLL
jgi:transcription-repair coupling factor (superfamily II helicase)